MGEPEIAGVGHQQAVVEAVLAAEGVGGWWDRPQLGSIGPGRDHDHLGAPDGLTGKGGAQLGGHGFAEGEHALGPGLPSGWARRQAHHQAGNQRSRVWRGRSCASTWG